MAALMAVSLIRLYTVRRKRVAPYPGTQGTVSEAVFLFRKNTSSTRYCRIVMDQMQQEILHSLFSSFSSSPTESRGSLYPYNYHFGQYSHSNTTHAGMPPVSHGLPSPQSRYHLGMISPGLIAGAHNFTSYGIHNARLPESESGSRQSHNTTMVQHGTADLRTDFRSNTRRSLSSSADQQYLVDHLRASSTQQHPSHKSSYSVIGKRIFEDPRAILESRTTKGSNHLSNKQKFNGKRTSAESKYPGNINTGQVPNTTSVSLGIHTSQDSVALPIKNSRGSHISSQVRPDEKMSSNELKLVIRRKHCKSSNQGTNKSSVCDRKALAAETNLVATLEQQSTNKTKNKGYQVVQKSETHTSHSSHTLNQNVNVRKLQEENENCQVNFNNKPLSLINNTHVSGNNNIFYDEEEDSSEDDSEEDEGLVEEDFDSEDSSTVTGQGNDTAVPTRRSARVPKPRIGIKELFEPLPDWLEAAMKQEPQSEVISEQKEGNSSRNRQQETNEGEEREQMCMFLEPEVRIKLEDESWGMEMREVEEERMVASS
ncbi:hypothetical protein Pmani_000782 [Petrolisthes manimaculis]|uniref:Uncharacterized protein n=1 Tax=Petrolisthes manimaculis TaxID=1843537 RepID=A0AAE1QLU9_9EUCA|nr:hypothetical protein Pmani_000782 [Petrolisthes manimaculis]